MTHLWQFLLQLLENDSFSSIISWSRKDRREFKLNNPEKVAQRWRIFKRNKAMTYKKLSRTLRYYYQQGNIKKVPGQRFVYRLNKRPLTCEQGIRNFPQVKSAPKGNTNTAPLRECWSRPTVSISCCPRCLCPRFLPPTTPGSGEGRQILLQIVDPSLHELVLPIIKTPPTSIPVSVIQKTTIPRVDY